MVTIPTPIQQGQPVGSVQTQDAGSQFYSVQAADTGDFGRDLMRLGQATQNITNVLIKNREDTNTLNAEREVFEWEQQMLDPQTGLHSRRGGDAAGVTDEYDASYRSLVERLREKYGGAVGTNGKLALDEMFDDTHRRIWRTVADYEAKELEVDRTRQHEAAVESLTDLMGLRLSIDDTAGAAAAATQLELRLEDEAIRQGYTGKAVEEYVERGKTNGWAVALTNMANNGMEVQAEVQLEYLLDNKLIDETDGRALLGQIAPAAKDKRDTTAAYEAYAGIVPSVPSYDNSKQPTAAALLPGLIQVESSGNPNARGPEVSIGGGRTDRAVGLVQVMERFLGKDYGYGVGVIERDRFLSDPEYQRRTGERILSAMLRKYNGNAEHALMAYNWGPGNVDKWLARGADPSQVPEETRKYVPKVMKASGYTRRAGSPEEDAAVVDDGLTPRERLMRDHGPGAVKKYDALVSSEYTRVQRERSAAYEQIVADLDQKFLDSPTVNLDTYLQERPGIRAVLGDNIIPLRNYIEKRNKGEDIPTIPASFNELVVLRETDPEAFARVPLIENYIDELDRTTLLGLMEDQAEILGKSKAGVTGADVRDVVLESVEAKVPAGIEGGRAYHVDRAVFAAREWAKDYEKQTGNRPTDLQLLTFTEKIALGFQFEVDLNPYGLLNLTGKDKDLGRDTFAQAAQQLDEDGLDEFIESRVDMTMSLPTAAGGVSRPVTISREVRREVAQELQDLYGRRPDGSEFLTALILRYTDAFNP